MLGQNTSEDAAGIRAEVIAKDEYHSIEKWVSDFLYFPHLSLLCHP